MVSSVLHHLAPTHKLRLANHTQEPHVNKLWPQPHRLAIISLPSLQYLQQKCNEIMLFLKGRIQNQKEKQKQKQCPEWGRCPLVCLHCVLSESKLQPFPYPTTTINSDGQLSYCPPDLQTKDRDTFYLGSPSNNNLVIHNRPSSV